VNLFQLKNSDKARLKISLSKKTCLVFNLGNLLWLETVEVALS
jgi:hypothetical protein